MAVKTITIDMEAYETLARHKRPGQSFSQVIKEHFGRVRTGADLLAVLERVTISEDVLDSIDREIAARRDDPAPITEL